MPKHIPTSVFTRAVVSSIYVAYYKNGFTLVVVAKHLLWLLWLQCQQQLCWLLGVFLAVGAAVAEAIDFKVSSTADSVL